MHGSPLYTPEWEAYVLDLSVLRAQLIERQEITAAARIGGSPDPAVNVTLQMALARAKKLGVPKDNVEAALKRASGQDAKDALQEVTYEALGPGGVPCLMYVYYAQSSMHDDPDTSNRECMTDNPTRTVMRVKEMLNRYGGRLAEVKYLFESKAIFRVEPKKGQTFDEVFELALEGGAEDVVQDEDGPEIEITAPSSLIHSLNSLLAPRTNLSHSEVVQIPTNPPEAPLDDEVEKLLEKLEEKLEENADCVRLWRGA
ncbi:YebC-like protein [Calocera cornea HHB12733]|uniref:YebC-like protein n=1 Tax=Calocera cornea HHB12733 TaxID=1353952 RepID=A0A165CLE7_9BASI|nr:YebC-like protein [Calocera cornea HHB12733]